MPRLVELIVEADKKSREILENARKQANEIVEEAKKRAKEIVEEAERSAETIVLGTNIDEIVEKEVEKITKEMTGKLTEMEEFAKRNIEKAVEIVRRGVVLGEEG